MRACRWPRRVTTSPEKSVKNIAPTAPAPFTVGVSAQPCTVRMWLMSATFSNANCGGKFTVARFTPCG